MLIIREPNCINTASGIVFSVSDLPVCWLRSFSIWPPDDEHRVARNMQRVIIINVIYIVHQVDHLPREYMHVDCWLQAASCPNYDGRVRRSEREDDHWTPRNAEMDTNSSVRCPDIRLNTPYNLILPNTVTIVSMTVSVLHTIYFYSGFGGGEGGTAQLESQPIYLRSFQCFYSGPPGQFEDNKRKVTNS